MGIKELGASHCDPSTLSQNHSRNSRFVLCTHVMQNTVTCFWQLIPFLDSEYADYFEVEDKLKRHILFCENNEDYITLFYIYILTLLNIRWCMM